MKKKLIILLVIITLLIAPALADDAILHTRDAGWQSIMTRINVNEPNNIVGDLLGNYVPDWARQGSSTGLPEGVHASDMAPWSSSFPHIYQFVSNTTSGEGVYPIGAYIYDLIGEGKWDFSIQTLEGVFYNGSIYKKDFITMGVGYSHFNVTSGGLWFNTTLNQPRIVPLGFQSVPFWWVLAYNFNTTQNAILVVDKIKHLDIGDLPVPPDQDPVIFWRIEGPGQIMGNLYYADYSALVGASARMTETGGDFLAEIKAIALALWGMLGTLYILFDFLVLRAGFVLFLAILEMGMMAVYMNQSKDVFAFFKKMIRGNKELFKFMSQFVFFIVKVGMDIVMLTATALWAGAGLVIGLIGSLI